MLPLRPNKYCSINLPNYKSSLVLIDRAVLLLPILLLWRLQTPTRYNVDIMILFFAIHCYIIDTPEPSLVEKSLADMK